MDICRSVGLVLLYISLLGTRIRLTCGWLQKGQGAKHYIWIFLGTNISITFTEFAQNWLARWRILCLYKSATAPLSRCFSVRDDLLETLGRMIGPKSLGPDLVGKGGKLMPKVAFLIMRKLSNSTSCLHDFLRFFLANLS